ncbi:hypothetical protein BDM02DRAFT_3131801 [Thelephora ganbajun]|uniref:Uncharacterized protein n=1 Tax=Thelephora ganbajun TaxID=370292 RepID=A0ACB6Z4A3_THEGA|nr:hypothetical protein BDM02DRAFT_3131801 [Thelephora ganbajun]
MYQKHLDCTAIRRSNAIILGGQGNLASKVTFVSGNFAICVIAVTQNLTVYSRDDLTKMKRLFGKKPKRSPNPSPKSISPGTPTNVAAGPLAPNALDERSNGDSRISTIAQTIAERIFADGQLGASFFCSRDFEDRRDLKFIFPTVAVQLARNYPKFRSIFVPLVQSDPEIAHESLYNQMDKLIARPLKQSDISTVIIIDALDECKDEEPASAILSVLGQFVSKIPKVKFFVTGRPEPRIREGFRLPLLAEATDVFVLHEVEASRVNSDIQLFFRHNFSGLKSRRRGLDDWPSSEQLDLLCERAAGLFVYAVATIKFIDHKNNNPKRQLERILQLPTSSVHEGKVRLGPNTTLDSLYIHHPELLAGCFGLMNQMLKKNMCNLPDAVANREVDDLQERTERHLDPALRYACKSWHKHLIDGHILRTPAIASALRRFLEDKFLFWLEALSVLGAAREAVDALGMTAKWLEVSPTLDLVTDCLRFVMGFFEIISTSCPHIYHYAPGSRSFVTWDLRTGGLVSTIALERPKYSRGHLSVTYSACGTMFAVLFCGNSAFTISIYNVLLGTHACSHSAEGRTLEEIWTHGKCLRFATVESRSITTWEAGFGSGHTPTQVESLPIPDDFHSSQRFRFHPASSRLAFVAGGSAFVWDAQDSKFLLESTDVDGQDYTSMSFSSDGRFFACGMGDLGVHLWKESPTGYTLHRRLVSNAGVFKSLVSPDGESIIAQVELAILLWHTTDSITSLSDTSALAIQRIQGRFILELSPDEALAAVTWMENETVTVLDLNSGVTRLTVDTGMKVYGVGMAGSVVVVVGEGKIVTWNLSAGNCVLNPRVDVNDSVLATTFDCPSFTVDPLRPISVSPDLRCIAVIGWYEDVDSSDGYYHLLHLYDVATGQCLASHRVGYEVDVFFSPDGREVWSNSGRGELSGWKITKDSESDIIRLEHLESSIDPPDWLPWESSRGYEVAGDRWVLSPSGKRLLWLPPRWRSHGWYRMWSGRFLALLNYALPEPVILELEDSHLANTSHMIAIGVFWLLWCLDEPRAEISGTDRQVAQEPPPKTNDMIQQPGGCRYFFLALPTTFLIIKVICPRCVLRNRNTRVKVAIPVYACSRSLLSGRHQSPIDVEVNTNTIQATQFELRVFNRWYLGRASWWDSPRTNSIILQYMMTPDIVSIPSALVSGDSLAVEPPDFEGDCEGRERPSSTPDTTLNWAERRNPEGCTYCYNLTTEESFWGKPKGDNPTKNQRWVIYVACVGTDFVEGLPFWREGVFP